jgi:hypothetical protein
MNRPVFSNVGQRYFMVLPLFSIVDVYNGISIMRFTALVFICHALTQVSPQLDMCVLG